MRIVLSLLLIFLVFGIYANSLKGPFLLDDDVLIRSNPLITRLSNIPVFFKTDIFAHSAEEKLRAYWTMKGAPPADRQERLLTKLAEVEKAVLSS